MAFRYPEDYPQDSDILEPQDWLRSQNAMAGEFNGKLDRDNLPESAVDNTHAADGTFMLVEHDRQDGASITAPSGLSTWVNGDGTDPFHYLEVEVEVDAFLEIHWSGQWKWADISLASGFPVTFGSADSNIVSWRVLVDGEEVARSPVHSQVRNHDSTGLVGALPVAPGIHAVEVECWVRSVGSGAQISDTITYENGELDVIVTKR